MLRLTVNTEQIEVRFDHKICNPDFIQVQTGAYVAESRRCSLATVTLNGNVSGIGMSVCNPQDNFCKATGRKRSLADGLRGLNRTLRTAVWEKYHSECKV